MSKTLNVPYSTKFLKRAKFTTTQTKKDKLDRRRNVSDVFLSAAPLDEGAHILIIDDVMTSGATLESAAKAVLNASKVKISFACLAVAEKF
jgi:predicted amidophosphoribosyltransferase